MQDSNHATKSFMYVLKCGLVKATVTSVLYFLLYYLLFLYCWVYMQHQLTAWCQALE